MVEAAPFKVHFVDFEDQEQNQNTDLSNIRCFLSPGFCYPFLFEAELSVFVAA